MISGECHVEGIPSPGSSSPADRRLALDGLRLRLDLRIVPAATGSDARAAAIWRIESDRVATLSLCVPSTFRRAAMLAGVGALALAVGVWFLDSPGTPTETRWESAAPTAGSAPSEAGSASLPTPAGAAGAVSAGGNSSDGSGPTRAQPSTAVPTRPALTVSPVRSTPEPRAIDAASERPLSVDVPETASEMRAVAPAIRALAADTAGSPSAGSASAGSASASPASASPASANSPVDLRPGAPPASPAAVPSRPDAFQREARPARGAPPPAGTAAASRRAAPAARTSDDMLDLFSDTK